MKVRALRSMVGEYGALRRGEIAEIEDHIAEKLLKLGRVELVGPPPAPVSEPVSGAGDQKTKKAGGRTGRAKPVSSLPAVQAPDGSEKTSPQSKAEPA